MGTQYNVDYISGIPTATDINDNLIAIEHALERSLSRWGDGTNSMQADLDMNNNHIYNLPEPVKPTEPARHGDINQYVTDAQQYAQQAQQYANAAAQSAVDAAGYATQAAAHAQDSLD